jgi:hypothetical protein
MVFLVLAVRRAATGNMPIEAGDNSASERFWDLGLEQEADR